MTLVLGPGLCRLHNVDMDAYGKMLSCESFSYEMRQGAETWMEKRLPIEILVDDLMALFRKPYFLALLDSLMWQCPFVAMPFHAKIFLDEMDLREWIQGPPTTIELCTACVLNCEASFHAGSSDWKPTERFTTGPCWRTHAGAYVVIRATLLEGPNGTPSTWSCAARPWMNFPPVGSWRCSPSLEWHVNRPECNWCNLGNAAVWDSATKLIYSLGQSLFSFDFPFGHCRDNNNN